MLATLPLRFQQAALLCLQITGETANVRQKPLESLRNTLLEHFHLQETETFLRLQPSISSIKQSHQMMGFHLCF